MSLLKGSVNNSIMPLMRDKRRFIFSGVVALVAANIFLTSLTGTAAASAPTPLNGVCEKGELCMFYLSDQTGSMIDLYNSIADFGPYKFITPGAGQGQSIDNNTSSVRNASDLFVYWLHRDKNAQGGTVIITSGTSTNLVGDANNSVSSMQRVLGG